MKQYDFVSRFLFFPIMILITGLFIAPLAVAGDLIISRGMLEKSAGTLTIADVVGREFKPVGPTLSDPCSDRDRATCSLSFVVNAVAPVTTYYLRLKTSTPSQQGGVQHVSRRII